MLCVLCLDFAVQARQVVTNHAVHAVMYSVVSAGCTHEVLRLDSAPQSYAWAVLCYAMLCCAEHAVLCKALLCCAKHSLSSM